MAAFLFLLACIAVFVSVAVFAAAETAFHEILAGVVGVSACVLLGCAFIVDAVNRVEKRLPDKQPPARKEQESEVPVTNRCPFCATFLSATALACPKCERPLPWAP